MTAAAAVTVNNFVDWGGEFHQPAWQANDDVPIQSGVTTVYDVLQSVQPALDTTSQGAGDNLYVTGNRRGTAGPCNRILLDILR